MKYRLIHEKRLEFSQFIDFSRVFKVSRKIRNSVVGLKFRLQKCVRKGKSVGNFPIFLNSGAIIDFMIRENSLNNFLKNNPQFQHTEKRKKDPVGTFLGKEFFVRTK